MAKYIKLFDQPGISLSVTLILCCDVMLWETKWENQS